MIKVGVVGMGKMGILHSAIFNALEGSRVSAFAEPDRAAAGMLSDLFKVPVYRDYREMLGDVDAACITTPAGTHAQIAGACAEAGLDFFVEKPLGTSWQECKALADAVEERGVLSMVGYHLRHSPTFLEAKRLLDSGAVGDITGVEASVYQTQNLRKPSGWRFQAKAGGGVLSELGSHLADLLSWYFGGVTEAECSARSVRGLGVEDEAGGRLALKGGIPCLFRASWNEAGYRLQETTIEVSGSRGSLKVNEDCVVLDGQTKYRQSLAAPVRIDVGGPEYTAEDQEFVACIKEGRRPSPDAASAALVQQVVDAARLSARTGKPQEVKGDG